MKSIIKMIIKLCISFSIAFVICSILIQPYHHQAGFLRRSGTGTLGCFRPGAFNLSMIEGYGYHTVDSKGYLNEDKPLEDNYILVIGSSNVEGFQVFNNERYSDILNNKLRKSPDSIKVYNVSHGAFVLPEAIAGFKAFIQEFPDAGAIVLETATPNYSYEQLKASLNQRELNRASLAPEIFRDLSPYRKIRMIFRECFAAFPQMRDQWDRIKRIQIDDKNLEIEQSNLDKQDEEEISELFKEMMTLIRSEYDGELVIICHPSTEFNKDGGLIIVKSKQMGYLKDACKDNNIVFMDMSKDFEDAYADNIVTHGFFNSEIGKGHLNKYGHRIIADRLYDYFKEKGF